MLSQIRNESGFTLIELTLVIVLVGILAMTAAAPDFGAVGTEAQNSQRNSVVSAIRGGVGIQYSQILLNTGVAGYPATLDAAADGACSVANPCFGTVVTPITSGWSKTGLVYTHLATGTAYTYTVATGTFQ